MNAKWLRKVGVFSSIAVLAMAIFGQSAVAKADKDNTGQLVITKVFCN